MSLENRMREHCKSIDWERFVTDKEYKERIVNKTKNLQAEKMAKGVNHERLDEDTGDT